jgi:Protein of unknown function (DUF2587)
MDTASTITRQPLVRHGEAAPRLAIVLDGPAGTRHADCVEAPDRVLRMWELLRTADDELQRVTLPPEAAARLQQQLETVTTELERSVSPELAGELRHLIGTDGTTAPTPAELRIEYASLLGWTGALVIGMLSQLETAHANPVSPDGRR